jgi:hypothetical protein
VKVIQQPSIDSIQPEGAPTSPWAEPITARGANLLIIDDPPKVFDEASSETVRTTMHDWFTAVVYTRLMPGGVIVVMQTRWHEDDLAGHLASVLSTPTSKANRSTWLRLPAVPYFFDRWSEKSHKDFSPNYQMTFRAN